MFSCFVFKWNLFWVIWNLVFSGVFIVCLTFALKFDVKWCTFGHLNLDLHVHFVSAYRTECWRRAKHRYFALQPHPPHRKNVTMSASARIPQSAVSEMVTWIMTSVARHLLCLCQMKSSGNDFCHKRQRTGISLCLMNWSKWGHL